MLYKIYEEESSIYYELKIDEIINLIKKNSKNIFYKFIENEKILINNTIVLETEFICHRINSIDELNNIPSIFGVEVDLRDCNNGKIIMSHDPFVNGEDFENYLMEYKHNNIILNIKSERIEFECLKLLEKNNVNNYFFLDSSFPMIYLLNKDLKNNNFACRFSEYEPIDNLLNGISLYKYIWVDCFTMLPLNIENYKIIKNNNIKICIVSPELQKQPEKIKNCRDYIIKNKIIPDIICCKVDNIINWI